MHSDVTASATSAALATHIETAAYLAPGELLAAEPLFSAGIITIFLAAGWPLNASQKTDRGILQAWATEGTLMPLWPVTATIMRNEDDPQI